MTENLLIFSGTADIMSTMYRSLVPSLTVCFCVMGTCAFGQHTYYVSKTLGSDGNTSTQAQSKATPWAHLPGMQGAAGNAGSYSPVAGDTFILRGGDTWTNGDLGINWTNYNGNSSTCALPYGSGSTAGCIYVGVDQTWYTGSSWSRPIFTCGGSVCASGDSSGGSMLWLWGTSYVVFDNIELTGWGYGGSSNQVTVNGTYTEIRNMYIHGWVETGTGNNGYAITAEGNNGYSGVGTYFDGNVIDGSDTAENTMNGFGQGDHIYNNVVRYVVSGLLIGVNDFHSNLMEYSVPSNYGDHCNFFFAQGTLGSSTTMYVYNNIIRHELCAGGSVMWATSAGGCASCVYYLFNNVVYDIASSFGAFSCGYHASAGSTGTCYMYNETLDLGGGAGGTPFGNSESGAVSTQYFGNNLIVGANGLCVSTGATCKNQGDNLQETEAQANAAGYTPSEAYAYSPTSTTSLTVGQGVNYSILCSATLAAICLDTSYPEYNATNHTVYLRAVNARPSSGAWDVGAYEYSGAASGGSVNTPTGMLTLSSQ